MKILSLTPYNTNNLNIKQNKNFAYQYCNNCDTVSFQGGRKKAVTLGTEKLVDEMMKSAEGNLGAQIKDFMSKPLTRNIFITTLVAMAAKVTEMMVNSQSATKEEKIENPVAKKQSGKREKITKSVKTETIEENINPKRKRYVSNMGEEAFKLKLQELSDKGLSLQEMGNELGGMTPSAVCKYIKKYGITRTKQSARQVKLNTEQEITKETTDNYFTENPESAEILGKIKTYKNLESGYIQLVESSLKKNAEDSTKDSLAGIEAIFKQIMNFPPRYRKQYLDCLNNQYASNIAELGLIFNNIPKGKSVQEYLAEFREKSYSSEFIDNWAKFPAFTSAELEMTNSLPEDSKVLIHELKKEGNFSFEIFKDEEWNNHKFVLRFPKNMDLSEKLKYIARFHEAINGNIYIHKDTGNRLQRKINLKEELKNLLVKDKNLDSLYNILRYIEPDMLKDMKYSNTKYLPIEELEALNYPIKQKFESVIKNIDDKNPRVKELSDVIDDDILFEKIMSNNHAKLRFISRFVLNKEVNEGELYDNCLDAYECLKEDLEQKIDDKCCVFPYKFTDSTAPCFYLAKSKLGDFIRVTLNNHGQIHTIFEDLKLKSRAS